MSRVWSQCAMSWLMNSEPLSESNVISGNGNRSRSSLTAWTIRGRVVADRGVLGPSGDQAGHRRCPSELACEGRPAVRHCVRLDRSRRRGRGIVGLGQPDRVAQQRVTQGLWSRCPSVASGPALGQGAGRSWPDSSPPPRRSSLVSRRPSHPGRRDHFIEDAASISLRSPPVRSAQFVRDMTPRGHRNLAFHTGKLRAQST